jgi:hypothetical protein
MCIPISTQIHATQHDAQWLVFAPLQVQGPPGEGAVPSNSPTILIQTIWQAHPCTTHHAGIAHWAEGVQSRPSSDITRTDSIYPAALPRLHTISTCTPNFRRYPTVLTRCLCCQWDCNSSCSVSYTPVPAVPPAGLQVSVAGAPAPQAPTAHPVTPLNHTHSCVQHTHHHHYPHHTKAPPVPAVPPAAPQV